MAKKKKKRPMRSVPNSILLRLSGVSAPYQRKLAIAIKRARNLALLSYTAGYVPQN